MSQYLRRHLNFLRYHTDDAAADQLSEEMVLERLKGR